ncbi:MAG: hypothetical protein RJA35_542 [Actinomycetota bacterium]|jgi:hypothetical protein
MAKDFPKDEFDSVSAPGGRHRAKRTFGSRLVSFIRYASVSVGLAVVGIVALNVTSGNSDFNTAGTTVTQAQFKAGGLGVTVVDATDRSGLASKVAHQLFDEGWNVLSATNYNLLPKWSQLGKTPAVTSGTAPSPTPTATATGPVIGEQTVIYVNSTDAQNAANEILGTLGKFTVVQSNAYADPITIILGNDYK